MVGVQSMSEWLETGLHLFRRYQARIESKVTLANEGHLLRLLGSSCDVLSPYDTIATRHTSKSIMAMLIAIDEDETLQLWGNHASYISDEKVSVRTWENHTPYLTKKVP